MPGRTSRPANWASTPTGRGAAIRASTRSTTCTAAVRPNRPIKARGSGSLFLMVPFATASAMTTPTGFHRYSAIVSCPSSWASSITVTLTVFTVSPGRNVSVPVAAS